MRWTFESEDAGSAYSARSGLLAYLRSRATNDSDIEAAALIFGELVGNVVRHAPGPISIDLTWERGSAILCVADRGLGFTWNGGATLPHEMAESGRGLFIAQTVAQRLEVSRAAGGGTVAKAALPVYLDPRFQQKTG